MTADIENIIKQKEFFELTPEELVQVGDYAKTEAEYEEMKWFLMSAGEAFEGEKIDASAGLKDRVMANLTESKKRRGFWMNSVGFMFPEGKKIIQMPGTQLSLAAAVVLGFLLFNGNLFQGVGDDQNVALVDQTELDEDQKFLEEDNAEAADDSFDGQAEVEESNEEPAMEITEMIDGRLGNEQAEQGPNDPASNDYWRSTDNSPATTAGSDGGGTIASETSTLETGKDKLFETLDEEETIDDEVAFSSNIEEVNEAAPVEKQLEADLDQLKDEKSGERDYREKSKDESKKQDANKNQDDGYADTGTFGKTKTTMNNKRYNDARNDEDGDMEGVDQTIAVGGAVVADPEDAPGKKGELNLAETEELELITIEDKEKSSGLDESDKLRKENFKGKKGGEKYSATPSTDVSNADLKTKEKIKPKSMHLNETKELKALFTTFR